MGNSYRVVTAVASLAAASIAGAGLISTGLMAATGLDPLAHLMGRWAGNAVITTASGSAANFKCVVTYLPSKEAAGVQQNLRCEHELSFKLHAATEIHVEGDKVVGRWQDKINDAEGTVSGKVTPTGFEVELAGSYFQATMAVTGAGCDQSVRVLPQKSEMFKELAATLKKC